jgi:signal peptidase I
MNDIPHTLPLAPFAQEGSASPRKPWVAATMSLALPGWGQLYNGQINRAIWSFLAFSLMLLPGTALVSLAVPPALMAPALVLGLLGTLGLWLHSAFDAHRVATRSTPYTLQPWQTSGLYALVFITCALLVLPTLTIAMRSHLVQPFHIPSSSMSPTLLAGDSVFANMHYNCHGCSSVRRGDVAIFTYPNDRGQYYVKRIVALPGDKVRIVGHRVVVNGEPLSASPLEEVQLERSGGKTWQVDGMAGLADSETEHTVPPGHVFLLGDNRTASTDSRQFGSVPLTDVVGRVRQIWFSHGDGGVRWGRIGQRVD